MDKISYFGGLIIGLVFLTLAVFALTALAYTVVSEITKEKPNDDQ